MRSPGVLVFIAGEFLGQAKNSTHLLRGKLHTCQSGDQQILTPILIPGKVSAVIANLYPSWKVVKVHLEVKMINLCILTPCVPRI